jgi:hypothetical protein
VTPTRYFLDQDNSYHWYIVDEARRDDWERWINMDEEDEGADVCPSFARMLGYGPNAVTFEAPRGLDGEVL